MDLSPFKASKATLALKSGLNLFLLPCTCTSGMRQCSHLKKLSNIRGPLQNAMRSAIGKNLERQHDYGSANKLHQRLFDDSSFARQESAQIRASNSVTECRHYAFKRPNQVRVKCTSPWSKHEYHASKRNQEPNRSSPAWSLRSD
jgi:hypothetical protein